MSFASLRRHVLMTSAGLAVAVVVPLGATTAIAPAAHATTAPSALAATTSVTTSAPTSAQLAAQAAAKKRAAKAAKKAAKKRAKKRAAIRKKRREVKRGKKVVRIAARYRGTPYRWGGASPSGFDCSGFTAYVARKAFGVGLPHYTVAQRGDGDVKRIGKKKRRAGDLVFFHRRGTIPHVAIYAGKGKMWDAPHSGSHVKKHRVHSGKKTYGRIV
jgi:cell wall-associated NlpC family hydrolase